ncbi:MAG: hypothetical protein GX424_04510 [Clostridiales bacterium]|nr:hypothetical protein [Clostridiales bacterium]
MQKRYVIKNFFFAFLFFSTLELFCFFSVLNRKNIFQVLEFSKASQSVLQACFALFYNLLYFFILAFISQFLSNKYNFRLLKNIWESFKWLLIWGLPVRLLVNFLYFFLNQIPLQYYSLKHEFEFLIETCFCIFICTIALYLPVKKQKPTLSLRQIVQGKKHIFLVLTAGILLLVTLRSFAYGSMFSYYNWQINKYVSPDISYLHSNMEYQDKLINLLSFTAVDILTFLCIFYIVNRYYGSYQNTIVSKRSKFLGIVMMVVLYNGVFAAATRSKRICMFAFEYAHLEVVRISP